MNFVKDSVNQQPIVDTVFTIVAKAKEAKEKYGADQVVDATIGSLYNEEGQLVALDSVFNSLKNLDNKVLMIGYQMVIAVLNMKQWQLQEELVLYL